MLYIFIFSILVDNESETSSHGESSASSSSVSSTILKKRHKTENTIEKRHKEKMARYDQFLKLFQLSVEHQIGRKIDEKEDQ